MIFPLCFANERSKFKLGWSLPKNIHLHKFYFNICDHSLFRENKIHVYMLLLSEQQLLVEVNEISTLKKFK